MSIPFATLRFYIKSTHNWNLIMVVPTLVSDIYINCIKGQRLKGTYTIFYILTWNGAGREKGNSRKLHNDTELLSTVHPLVLSFSALQYGEILSPLNNALFYTNLQNNSKLSIHT